MYLLNIDGLVSDLRAGRVRVRDARFHKAVLLALALVSWVSLDLSFDVKGATRASALLFCQILALYLIYCANGLGSSSARITRLAMIGGCVGLRILCCIGLVVALDFPGEVWQTLLGRAADVLINLQSFAPPWIACGCSVLWGLRVTVHLERASDVELTKDLQRVSDPTTITDRRASFFGRHDEQIR